MRSLAAGAIVVGLVSIVCALTLLPALLGLLGDRVNALRVPLLARNLGRSRVRRGAILARDRAPRPAPPAGQPDRLDGGDARRRDPILGLHVGSSGVSSLPNSMPSKQGYVALSALLPGAEHLSRADRVEGGDPTACTATSRGCAGAPCPRSTLRTRHLIVSRTRT